MDLFQILTPKSLRRNAFDTHTFLEPILYLAALANSWEHAPNIPSILIDREADQPVDVRSPSVDCLTATIVDDQGSKNRQFITKALEEEATVMKPVSKKKKTEDPRRMSARDNVPPLPTAAAKGIGKHTRLLARYIGNLARSSDSLAPNVMEAHAAHNMLSSLHYPLFQDKLSFLSFDELVNVYDIYALQMAMVGNMLSNESMVISLLEHEMSKLEDQLIKAQKSQDFEGWLLPRGVKETNFRGVEWFATPFEGDANLEKASLVKDFLPLVIKKLFESKHFNQALGDLQHKAITFCRSQALGEVHGLGDSWDFKDVADYHPKAEKIYDEADEAFYKHKIPYMSLIGEKAGQSLEELTLVEAASVQEALSS
ncbi:hypothetical protein Tco_1232138 [Tanacetum coccineum]